MNGRGPAARPRKTGNDFHRVHAECVSALGAYMAEADKLCRMLQLCQGHTVSATEQVALLDQRQRESDAHAEYHRARKLLLRRTSLNTKRKNLRPYSIAV